uniref:Uncharacterized protein n=1 Tax=viral metagenome TaxID=1070528 RepID=A0A6C0C895_9ZZZZ
MQILAVILHPNFNRSSCKSLANNIASNSSKPLNYHANLQPIAILGSNLVYNFNRSLNRRANL